MPYYRGGEGVTYDFGLNDLQGSLWDAMKAQATEGFTGGVLGAISRGNEDTWATKGRPVLMGDSPFDIAMQDRMFRDMQEKGIIPKPKMIDKTTADQKAKAAGVKLAVPEQGISEDYLKLLIERKLDENARASAINAAPSGITSGTLQFFAGVAGGLADPTNIALSFIPVVGEAKYAAMLESAGSAIGRTAVRAGVGAVEGAVGQAIVEPITALDRIANQQDYGLGTALMDIGLGAGMGSAAHVGMHSISSAWGHMRERFKTDDPAAMPNVAERVAPEINEAAMRAIAAADAEGRVVDIAPILKLDPRAEALPAKPLPAGVESLVRNAADANLTKMANGIEAKIRARNATDEDVRVLEAIRAEQEKRSGGLPVIDHNAPVTSSLDEVKAAVQESAQPTADRYADHEAKAEAEAKAPEAAKSGELEEVKAMADEASTQVKEIEAQEGVETSALKAADEYAARAQTYAQALKAAAVCGVR